MKTYHFFTMIIATFFLGWTVNATAQDDVYFDPSTDESPLQETYTDVSHSDAGEDYPFEDESRFNEDDDYYYSRKIRRFNRKYSSNFGYYNNWYTNDAFVCNDWNGGWSSPYNGSSNLVIGVGNVFYSQYNSPFTPYGNYYGNGWGYNPYYSNPYAGYYTPYYYNSGYYNNSYYGNSYSKPSDYYANHPRYNYTPRRGGVGKTVNGGGHGRTETIKVNRPKNSRPRATNNNTSSRPRANKPRRSGRSRASSPRSSTPRSSNNSSSSSSSSNSGKSNNGRSGRRPR